MARKTARPGRTLVVFFLGLAIAYGAVALGKQWTPELGLDLQGGTRITLIAKGDPTDESMEEARQIVDQRVNGSGVTEAEVVTESGRIIVVEIPGETRRDLVETVQRQAQLRFRLVACSPFGGVCSTGAGTGTGVPGDPGTGQPEPGAGVTAPADPAPEGQGGGQGNGQGQDAGQGDGAGEGAGEGAGDGAPEGSANRAATSYAQGETPSDAPSATDAPTDAPSDAPSDAPTPDASEGPAAGGTEGAQVIPAPEGGPNVGKPLEWYKAPNQEAIDAYNAFECPPPGTPANVEDDPAKPLISCDTETGAKYLMSASMIEGTALKDAAAEIPQQSVQYVVTLKFDGPGTEKFAEISEKLFGTEDLFAIVLDGQVLSAPTMEGLITNGEAQISGDFTQASAESLATSLKFGALPVAFEDPSTETIGPSLAGDQLSAGLVAGGFGLGLVLIYCMLYYRGLGLVVVASLLVAAAATYALVLLLSKTAGFTLTLPGIAGLIIAVGVTADSFIIFFERIRDEMREGKSMRVAVETGWKRAKVTRLAAQVVSLLSAAVLYIFATGAVKGFGFALGLSTIVDLAILFWFTKPMVSWLGQFHFFNSGHRLSGLSKGTLGMDAAPTVPQGGRA
ncbi:protein translocase subunit SecD [Nocardioides sp. SYSU D00038]|uniref:protein translocase subunit SecD n=1 Tax=Nocardioides sp. SYSU D00038 TaxID=2812554 RepID=UPI0019670CC6|nr:protein translocase subunit SecD [Nocardioides sp. SYSU D00038]